MIDEYEEFRAYTELPQYTAAGKRDTTWGGRFTLDRRGDTKGHSG